MIPVRFWFKLYVMDRPAKQRELLSNHHTCLQTGLTGTIFLPQASTAFRNLIAFFTDVHHDQRR